MAGIFKRGYKAVADEKQRQDENREKMNKGLYRFFIKDDGEEVEVRFLTEEPVNFYEHTEKVNRQGKEYYDNHICTGEDCERCDNGDRPTFKGAYLIWDTREFKKKDEKGKEITVDGSLKLYVQGTKVLSQLDRISTKYGLSNREVSITRLGKGNTTTYTIDRGDENKLTRKQIEAMLPELIRREYDGTMESLYAIIEEQLSMSMEHASDKDEDEDEKPKKDYNKNLVNDDEDEEDEYQEMSLADLKECCDDRGIEYSKLAKKTSLIRMLKESDEEEEVDLPFKKETKVGGIKKSTGLKTSAPSVKKLFKKK